jgi:hypothetical protein
MIIEESMMIEEVVMINSMGSVTQFDRYTIRCNEIMMMINAIKYNKR